MPDTEIPAYAYYENVEPEECVERLFEDAAMYDPEDDGEEYDEDE